MMNLELGLVNILLIMVIRLMKIWEVFLISKNYNLVV